MAERRIGCGAWILVILGVALVYGFVTTRDPGGSIAVRVEATLPGPCPGTERSFVIEPGTGSAKTVQLDHAERTDQGCVFRGEVTLPDADRYRVTVPGTDLPGRTITRGVMDERDPDGTVHWVLRVTW